MLFVGIGGTVRPQSSSESALRTALEVCAEAGHEIRTFTGDELNLPLYDPRTTHRSRDAQDLIESVRDCHGIILSSPGYHGGASGLLKNALDYIEDLAHHDSPYLEGRAVGCITTANGWQAAVSTLGNLRDIVHALRGWPTPYGAAINTQHHTFADGHPLDTHITDNLRLIGQQVLTFAQTFPTSDTTTELRVPELVSAQ